MKVTLGIDMKISIITATFNVKEDFKILADSVINQTYSDYEWIVVDGGSLDGTVEILEELSNKYDWFKFISEKDFGFYDALNKAVKLVSGKFYIVMGADDILYNDSLTKFADVQRNFNADLVASKVDKNGHSVGGFFPKKHWLGHANVFSGSHSVGMLIKKDLHRKYGFYSKRFPMLADGYFLKRLVMSKDVKIVESEHVSGIFSMTGMSNTNMLQVLAETWQIQMLTEKHKLTQILLFFARVIKNYMFHKI